MGQLIGEEQVTTTISAAVFVAQARLVLERERRQCLSGNRAARLAKLSAKLRDIGEEIEQTIGANLDAFLILFGVAELDRSSLRQALEELAIAKQEEPDGALTTVTCGEVHAVLTRAKELLREKEARQ